MGIEAIWEHYQSGGYAAARTATPQTAEEQFYLAVLAFSSEQVGAAADHAAEAVQLDIHSSVMGAATSYLRQAAAHGKTSVYVSGEAFAAFIRGGGNLPLYQALSNGLRLAYDDYTRLDLLDIGVGDGLALIPALAPCIARLDVVEPATAMLERASAALQQADVPHHAHAEPVEQFIGHANERWDLIQATFSLQSLPPALRSEVLPWLHRHGDRLLVAEFDVPDLGAQLAPARFRHMVARYEQGLGEYRDDNGLVAQGFLMPVFFGAFDQSAARTNYEQSIALWELELRAAGYQEVERRPLYNYWWAPAYLLDAR